MKLFIITGASKGLGLSLLKLVLDKGHCAITLSRSKTIFHPNHHHIKINLSNPIQLEKKLNKALSQFEKNKIKGIVLINNAASVEPIGDFDKADIDNIKKHINLNFLTPILISKWFMTTFQKRRSPLIIANISSGAALHPISNWSLYCSTKSALLMFTNCLIRDNEHKKNFKAFSFSPGVMDTNMQETIRKQSKQTFKDIERFKDLKQKNLLKNPDKVASKLYGLLEKPDKINQNHYDIRNI